MTLFFVGGMKYSSPLECPLNSFSSASDLRYHKEQTQLLGKRNLTVRSSAPWFVSYITYYFYGQRINHSLQPHLTMHRLHVPKLQLGISPSNGPRHSLRTTPLSSSEHGLPSKSSTVVHSSSGQRRSVRLSDRQGSVTAVASSPARPWDVDTSPGFGHDFRMSEASTADHVRPSSAFLT